MTRTCTAEVGGEKCGATLSFRKVTRNGAVELYTCTGPSHHKRHINSDGRQYTTHKTAAKEPVAIRLYDWQRALIASMGHSPQSYIDARLALDAQQDSAKMNYPCTYAAIQYIVSWPFWAKENHTEEMYWYNYKTEQYEYITTPQDFTSYIPQVPAAQGLYSCHLAMGKQPIEAAKETLLFCVGKKAVEQSVQRTCATCGAIDMFSDDVCIECGASR